MSRFVESLEAANARDTRARAVLRRSLAFDPGAFAPVYPYVEPFVGESLSAWQRTAFYLVAGLWASHWREGQGHARIPLARAAAAHQIANGSASTERRFINLLDADEDQLPYRLRQMVALLKDQPIDFDALLNGLLRWNDDRKPTQIQWARDFYRAGRETVGAQSPSTDGAIT